MKNISDRSVYYPFLMAVSAGLMGIAGNPEDHYNSSTASTYYHFAIVFTGTYLGYYLATLKPEIDLIHLRFKSTPLPYRFFIIAITVLFACFNLKLNPLLSIQFFLALVFTLSYYTRIQTTNGFFGGTRSILFLKNLVLAISWALVTSPIHPGENDTKLLFLNRGLFLLALSICIDIRDIAADRNSNIRTIPILIGTGKTKITAAILLVIGLSLVYYEHYLFPGGNLYKAATISSVCTMLAILNLNENSTRKKFLWLIDGNLLLHGILFYIYSNHDLFHL